MKNLERGKAVFICRQHPSLRRKQWKSMEGVRQVNFDPEGRETETEYVYWYVYLSNSKEYIINISFIKQNFAVHACQDNFPTKLILILPFIPNITPENSIQKLKLYLPFL